MNCESTIVSSVDELVAAIPHGASVALPKDSSGAPVALVKAMLRKGVRALHVICVPTGGLTADLLIGAGAVSILETSAVTLGEFGAAPCFTRAAKHRSIQLRDATCPAIYAALQAGEKGLPFMPLRGILGSDLVRHRADWKTIDNPFANGTADPLLLLPALNPDYALLHAPKADRAGNVWIGVQGELSLIAHAARHTLVTVEEIVGGDLMADEASAAGTLPSIYVDAIAEARGGCLPLGFRDDYGCDDRQLGAYIELAVSDEGVRDYLQRYA